MDFFAQISQKSQIQSLATLKRVATPSLRTAALTKTFNSSSTRAASTSGCWRSGPARCARWTSSSTTDSSKRRRRKRKPSSIWPEQRRQQRIILSDIFDPEFLSLFLKRKSTICNEEKMWTVVTRVTPATEMLKPLWWSKSTEN